MNHVASTVVSAILAIPVIALADPLMDEARDLFEPIPDVASAVGGAPAIAPVVALGTMLFFEPRLSESHSISCNTCHVVGMGGVDMLETSVGHRWMRGGRNSPTVLNAVFNTAQFWDGRAADLKEQAGGPLVNPVEMATTAAHAIEMLKAIPGYAQPFADAFPDDPDPISLGNVEAAIAAFEARLITPDAPFDLYLKGDAAALVEEEKKGLTLFIETGCANCHNGVNIGGGMYAPFGVVEKPGAEFLPPDDHGRFEVTKSVDDEYVYKVPTLRNIELTPPYFHTGRSWDLRQAVAVMATSQLGADLSASDIDAITAFLRSLTGKQPQVIYPTLPPSVATTPTPQP